MSNEDQPPAGVDELLHVPTEAIESENFKAFLDHIPVGVIIARIRGNRERIIYANIEFERISGHAPAEVDGQGWAILDVHIEEERPQHSLGRAVLESEEFLGTFQFDRGPSGVATADAYSNVIEDENGDPRFRLLALVDVTARERSQREQFEQQIREKDLLLKELQHRVKNNLQLITALIRLEARTAQSDGRERFDRLAGRIESLQLLYQALMADDRQQEVDLGQYLGKIASAVMHTHGTEGIRLNLKVDYLLISINIAMPVGLLVNELLTNAFKYAFGDREGGTITLRCIREDPDRVQIVVADDGRGLPEGTQWPRAGKMAALMLRTLQENAGADWQVGTAPAGGTSITLRFSARLKAQDAKGISLNGPFLIKSEAVGAGKAAPDAASAGRV